MVALFSIACDGLGHIGVPGQMRRCRKHRGRCISRAVRHTIGFGTLRFGERDNDMADYELPFFTLHHFTLTLWTWISSLDAHIMSNRNLEDGLRQLDGTWCIRREDFLDVAYGQGASWGIHTW